MVLHRQAREDTKRNAKLFKNHVEANNSHYKICLTRHDIAKVHETAGTAQAKGAYKAGVAKALYCCLVGHDYQMDDALKCIADHGFIAFADNEYLLVIPATPLNKVKDGKWV